jgi:hypothetical protein
MTTFYSQPNPGNALASENPKADDIELQIYSFKGFFF